MSEIIISLRKIYYKTCKTNSKRFYYSLKDNIKRLIGRSVNYRIVRPYEKMIFNNFSFKLRRGEIVGFLGTHSSGKFTLLKIIAGSISINDGSIIRNGQVFSLDEIKDKLIPSKSGNDNILLFSSNLGNNSEDVVTKMKEIIAFSDLHELINYPIYTYSSEMKLQLEIAILLHLNADVFIIDEHFGLNNIIFNNKVLKRLLQLKYKSKGLVLVNIGFDNLKRIVDRGLILNNGNIIFEGEIVEAIQKFEDDLRHKEVSKLRKSKLKPTQNKIIEFLDMGVLDINTSKSLSIGTNQHFNFYCDFKIKEELTELTFSINFVDELNKSVFSFSNSFKENLNEDHINLNEANFRLVLQLPIHYLSPGIYFPKVTIKSVNFPLEVDQNWPSMPFYVHSNKTIDDNNELNVNWMLNPLNLNTNNKNLFSKLKPGDIAIDCGANVGEVTAIMAEKGATVYAFEPNPYAFKLLKKRFDKNNNVILINKGVWDKKGILPLYLHENNDLNPEKHSVSSSILESKKNIDKINFVEIELINLIDFIENLNHEVALLKLDVEGAEVDILNKLIYSKSIKNIREILVETHEKQIPELFKPTQALRIEIKKLGLNHINLNWV